MSIRVGMSVALVLALPVSARAAGPPSPSRPLDLPLEGVSTAPDWLSLPDGDAVSREFPPLPQMLGIGGRAVISCEINPAGGLDACRVVTEAPGGLGFGPAAVRLAPYFHMKPATLDGKPMGGSVKIPISFKLESEEQPPLDESAPSVDAESLQLAVNIYNAEKVGERAHAGAQVWLDQLAAMAAGIGDTPPGQKALVALQQAAEEVIDQDLEYDARRLASRMSVTDLRVTATFMNSPAGQAWASAQEPTNRQQTFLLRLGRAARRRLCDAVSCPGTPNAASPPNALPTAGK